MQICFSVANVRAGDCALPESEDEFFSGNVAPALGDVAFVFDFVEDDGLSISVAIKDRAGGVFDSGAVLDTGVGNPGTGVIEQLLAVVNGKEAMIWIGGGNNLA